MTKQNTFDAFFSYARADHDAAKPYIDALRDIGLTVFIDEDNVERFESITERIQHDLAHSKALVAFYTTTYPQRAACQWELTAACITGHAEGDPRRRVLVLNPEDSAGHIHPVEIADARFIGVGSGGESPSQVAAAVKARLDKLDSVLGEVQPLEVPTWRPHNPIHWQRFVGRTREMWKVHRGLTGGRWTLITGKTGAGTATVRGLGGIGKTVLAEEYGLRFQYAYPGGVCWLDASQAKGEDAGSAALAREQAFVTMAEEWGLSVHGLSHSQVRSALRGAIDAAGKPVLWIVDDLPVGLGDEEARRWQGPSRLCNTLVTTRSSEYGGDYVDLGVLTEDEALELLSLHRRPCAEEVEHARALARDLGCHALACEVTGSLLARGTHSYKSYRELLAKPDSDALELSSRLKGVLPRDHERSIAATLLRSVDALDDEGLRFLQVASSLGPMPFSTRLAAGAFDRIHSDGAGDAFEAGASDAELHSLCKHQGPDEQAYRVHELVARTVRHHRMPDGFEAGIHSAAVEVLNELLPAVADIRSHSLLAHDVAQARYVLDVVEDDVRSAELSLWVGRHDYERGLYVSARKLQEQELEVRGRVLGKEHPSTLTSMNNLAETFRAQGELGEARKLQEQVLKVRGRVLGEKHPDTLTSMNNLAVTFRAQGELGEARKLQEQVLKVRGRVLGEEHPSTLTSMNNLAETLRDQGELGEARKLQEQVVEVMRRVLGEEHPSTLTSMNNLAGTLGAQGELGGARKLQERVLEVRGRVLGEEHPDTLTSMNNLAHTSMALGDWNRALELVAQALSGAKKTWGDEHPNTKSLAAILEHLES